jgi:hypothetical protein
MRVDEIEKLLVKYYDSNTTDAEEEQLKEYFCGEEVPPHLLNERKCFGHCTVKHRLTCPDYFETSYQT